MLKNIYIQICLGLVVVIAATWGAITLLSRHTASYSAATVSRHNLTETITATGNVTANQDVMLAFNMQGKVTSVYADVGSTTHAGEVLAALDSSSLRAQIAGAQADVEAAQAKLAEMQRGARPEELAMYQQKYSDASTALITAMKNAYLQSENAILNKSDSVFSNGASANPTIMVRTQSQTEQLSINQARVAISDTLNHWKTALAPLTNTSATSTDPTTIDQARTVTADSITNVKAFLDRLGTIAGNLSAGNSGMSQASIDTVNATINSASQQVTTAMSAEQTADAAWSSARDSLALEQAGSRPEDIQAQQAVLDKAQATVQGLQSQLNQSYIISPFDGIITAMNIKIGEVYVPGISASEGISLQSNGNYKIETYVPETDIGKLQNGDPAAVTFDAYGPNTVFPAHVSLIDPAQTIQNGVNAYKVTITFDNPSDARIKSGLTANAIITAATATNALAVPTRAIITKGSDKFVLVRQSRSSNYIQQPVQTGLVSADGYTQIISGVNEGDAIASFGTY